MLNSLKKIFEQSKKEQDSKSDDLNLLCGLMVEAANIDGVVDPEEINQISNLLISVFNEDPLLVKEELELNRIHLVGFSLGSLIARHFAAAYGDKLSCLVLHSSIYKRSVEQNRVVQNRFELMKTSTTTSQDRALRRWFSEKFIKENKEVYYKIHSILEDNNLSNLLKSY